MKLRCPKCHSLIDIVMRVGRLPDHDVPVSDTLKTWAEVDGQPNQMIDVRLRCKYSSALYKIIPRS